MWCDGNEDKAEQTTYYVAHWWVTTPHWPNLTRADLPRWDVSLKQASTHSHVPLDTTLFREQYGLFFTTRCVKSESTDLLYFQVVSLQRDRILKLIRASFPDKTRWWRDVPQDVASWQGNALLEGKEPQQLSSPGCERTDDRGKRNSKLRGATGLGLFLEICLLCRAHTAVFSVGQSMYVTSKKWFVSNVLFKIRAPSNYSNHYLLFFYLNFVF